MNEPNPSRNFDLIRHTLGKPWREYSFTIGEGALELVVNLFAMILVERRYAQQGLGIYSYLLALFLIGGHVVEFGLCRYVERETALHQRERSKQKEVLSNAHQAIFLLGLLFAVFCFLSAAYDAAHTRVQENLAAYVIVGLAVPLRNLTRMRLAVLHGHGQHERVARFKTTKRFIFIGAIFLLSTIGVAPSFLVLAFLITEFSLMVLTARKSSLPPIRNTFTDLNRLRSTLREGYMLLFTEDFFDIILYVDLLILGIFLPAWDLGVYAEATVLARFFLLVPMSIRPIFRRKYCTFVAEKQYNTAATMVHKSAATLFFLHSLLALYLLLYFPEILHLLFRTHGEELLSYRIFTVLIPGLLFCGSVAASEPLYEAAGRLGSLRKLVVSVSLINLVLNFYLIPFARFFGAATATTISTLVYFFLFGSRLEKHYRIRKGSYVLAGGAVYLTFLLVGKLNIGVTITFFLIPLLLFSLFLSIGFFHYEPLSPQSSSGADKTE